MAKPLLPMRLLAAITAVCVVSTGCGDGRPARVPVSGRVTIDGQPLSYGFIQFRPAGARASSARLNSEGRFTLKCFEDGDGAIPGQHEIVVMANEQIGANKTLWHTPKKYADQQTSGLKQEITGPTENLTIHLSWDGGRPFVEDDNTGAIEPYRPAVHRRNDSPQQARN